MVLAPAGNVVIVDVVRSRNRKGPEFQLSQGFAKGVKCVLERKWEWARTTKKLILARILSRLQKCGVLQKKVPSLRPTQPLRSPPRHQPAPPSSQEPALSPPKYHTRWYNRSAVSTESKHGSEVVIDALWAHNTQFLIDTCCRRTLLRLPVARATARKCPEEPSQNSPLLRFLCT